MNDKLVPRDRGFMGFLRDFTMGNTDRVNKINRSITEYNATSIDAFFSPENGVYNSIISGGDINSRTNAIIAQARCAIANKFPVIVLHEGNRMLENKLERAFNPQNKYFEISNRCRSFEPFYGLDASDVTNEILEIAPKDFDIKYSARYYIEGVSEILKYKKKYLSFKMLLQCPHAMIFDIAEDLYNQGVIDDKKEHEIKSKLMMGQGENYKIDALLNNLSREVNEVRYLPKCGFKPNNIIKACDRNAVTCIDIVASKNKLYIDTLVYQLELATKLSKQYVIIVDSIFLNSTKAYESFMLNPSEKIGRMIASDDLFSMAGGDEKNFSILTATSPTMIIMAHQSAKSAEKWSEVLGQYERWNESYSNSRGASKNSPFSLFSSPNYQNSTSLSKSREFVVRPEQILHLSRGEAFVMSTACGNISHLFFNG